MDATLKKWENRRDPPRFGGGRGRGDRRIAARGHPHAMKYAYGSYADFVMMVKNL